MKRFSKLLCFMVVFISVMTAFCTVSFADEGQYTDNLIPAMTSNTLPSGVVSASGYVSTGSPTYDPYKAFNKNTGYYDYWCSGRYNGWLAYEFSSPQAITEYTLNTAYNYVQMFPKNWTFEAWDGSSWIVLDTRNNITDWVANVKKEFYFNNSTSYSKYRINISMTVGGTGYSVIIGEMEMMASIVTVPTAPTNLIATGGNAKVDLSWDGVEGATGYIVKRSLTPGGPYDTITTSSAITYTDTNVTNGTTYYYVVTAVVNGVESDPSNEASATPTAPTDPEPSGNNAILEITMITGEIKEYDLTAGELQSFLNWYDGRSNGTDKAYYMISKKNNIKPFLSRKEYIAFDKISSFEVKEYTE